MIVGAVVVTYRRPLVVLATVRALTTQTTPVDEIIVVDNAADDELRTILARELPAVSYEAAPENLGYGAGLAHGMRQLRERCNPDWYWLLDDDTPPVPTELADALAVATSDLNPAVVANRGGHLRWGRIRHDLRQVATPATADFTLVDGALIARSVIESVGVPREDLFMMHEDLEYTTRIADAGGVLVVRPSRSTAMHLGSTSDWRTYYQARNHLRIALDRRSVTWLLGWSYRMLALTTADLLGRRWRLLLLRWRGVLDAVRGRMGRTVEP